MRKTKIIATLGPASFNPETISALIEQGIDVARINMSHYSESVDCPPEGVFSASAEKSKDVLDLRTDSL